MARRPASTSSTVSHARLRAWLNLALVVSALLAVTIFVLLYGGFAPESLPVSRSTLITMQMIIVAWFIADRFLRLFWANSKRAYLRSNWIDFTLIAILAIALLATWQYDWKILSAGTLYIIITEAYLLASLGIRAASANLRLAGSGLRTSWLLIGSFAAACLLGSGLLMLPVAVPAEFRADWSYSDALFTATSATCVTGLIVADTGSEFTLFGQAVILVLIQLGGLGIMMFGTVMALLAGKSLTVRSQEVIGEMVGEDTVRDLARAVRFVLLSTALLEAIGIAGLYPMFRSLRDTGGELIYAPHEALWQSTFHSISAFCNAGFSLFRENLLAGTGWPHALRTHWQILGLMGPLIVLGGLGFPVLRDLSQYARSFLRRHWLIRKRPRIGHVPLPRAHLGIHSRIVLLSSVVLVVAGAGMIGILEYGNEALWEGLSPLGRVREAIFQSVTARTAGFNTLRMHDLSDAGKLWMCLLMTIGGSPAGTAGGMKTVTVVLLILAVASVLRNRDETEVFHRSIAAIQVRRALTVFLLYMLLLFVILLLLCVSIPGHSFLHILFESCSACGTVGLSVGVTGPVNTLQPFAKLVFVLGMFVGRVGPLTVLLALAGQVRPVEYAYPTESVVIG